MCQNIFMIDDRMVDRVLKEGFLIAKKIQETDDISSSGPLLIEIEKYCDFVNENFGVVDDFSENKKYCDIDFYIHMAIKEKEEHLEYYKKHGDITSNGILDFLDYLNSKEWLKTKNADQSRRF